MAKGKTKWKQKKQKRINSKLLYNAVNWQLCYITCIYSEIILIILIVLWIVVFACKKLHTQAKKMGVR